VDRLSTRCTAAQIYIYLKQGLYDLLENSDINVYVNDCDQDVCLSTWLVAHGQAYTGVTSEPKLNRLLFAIDMLDTCAGNYPLNLDSALFEECLWIFEPYSLARIAGIHLLDAAGMQQVISAVHTRIDLYLQGKSLRLKADTRFKLVAQGLIPIIQELGLEARSKLTQEGIDVYVSYKGSVNNRYNYSIVKLSPLHPIDLNALYHYLNNLEDKVPLNGWGGSNTCGGSPRLSGSKYSPEQLAVFLKEFTFQSSNI
jgi:hypothetical protein